MLMDVCRALAALEAERGQTYETKFRMADFADFILKVAPVLSTRHEVEAILERLSQQQVAFASDDEPLLDLIDEWLSDDSGLVNIEREITLAQLGTELTALAGHGRRVPWDSSSPKSFGQYFRGRAGTLKGRYEITERKAHGGIKRVSFRRRHGELGGLGETSSATPLVPRQDSIGNVEEEQE